MEQLKDNQTINIKDLQIIKRKSFKIAENTVEFGIIKRGYFISVKNGDNKFEQICVHQDGKRSLFKNDDQMNGVHFVFRVDAEEGVAEEYNRIKTQSSLVELFSDECEYIFPKGRESFEYEDLIAISVRSTGKEIDFEILDSSPLGKEVFLSKSILYMAGE